MEARVRWPTSFDVTVALVFVVVAETEMRLSHQNVVAGTVPIDVDSVLVLLPVVPLILRRSFPLTACIASGAAMSLVGGVLHGTVCFFGGLFAFLVALYSAAAWARAPLNRVAAVVPVIVVAPMHWYVADFRLNYDLIFGLVLAGLAWGAGHAARRWRQLSLDLAEALSDAEAGRDAQAALAVAEERTRIARELHDALAHSVSVMLMQAAAARPAVLDDPDGTVRALEGIELTGRAAMTEIRQLLGLLRDGSSPVEPQPRLSALPPLLEQLATTGLEVSRRIEGEPRSLPRAVELSAYQIIREALTNALRHGAGGRAELTLRWCPDQLVIEVANAVGAGPAHPGGHGLLGIRERAALFGGTARTVVDHGRFVMAVTLPYERALASQGGSR